MLELGFCKLHGKVFGACCVSRYKWQVDVSSGRRRKFALRLFRRLFQALHSHHVLRQVDAVLLFEFIYKPLHHKLVKVVAAQMRVAVGGFYFKDAVTDFEDGDVKCTATKVVNCDGFLFFLIESVCQRSRCRLVYYA